MSRARKFRLLVALTAAALLAVTATAFAVVRTTGATADFTAPACDAVENCQALTKMTVFQMKIGSRENSSKVARAGKVMAFSLYLPRVIAKYYADYTATYDGAPTARVSILRYAPRKGVTKFRYKLVAQSPRYNLKNYLGGQPSFVLDKPLDVKKGDIVALTTDTWMPGFVVRSEDATSTWRSSRPKGKCSQVGKDITNLTTARMHSKINQIKQYNCLYSGARILFNATVVDTPVKPK